jgi:hypothetical protein
MCVLLASEPVLTPNTTQARPLPPFATSARADVVQPSSPSVGDFDDHLAGGAARPLSDECFRQSAERKYLADGGF